jgi:hypothetical protein
VRRISVALLAFLASTGLILVLPVYAAPLPQVRAVPPSVEAIGLASVAAPAGRAGVSTTAGTALTLSLPATRAFSALGVTWAHDAAVTDVSVRIRVTTPNRGWGAWTALETEGMTDAGGPGGRVRDGTAPYWAERATGVEAVVRAVHGRDPHDVKVELIDPGTSPADATPGPATVQDQAHAGDWPTIYSRAQWGADESIRTWAPQFTSTIKAATIHHTATANGYTPAEVPEIIRSIYAFHAISRGWGDIGYNVLVDAFGRAWEGRYSGSRGVGSPVIGAHAGGFNAYTVGVSMIGDFTSTPPPAATIATVADVIAWKFRSYRVNPIGTVDLTSAGGGTSRYPAGTVVRRPTIFGHRDVGFTTCPGDAGYAALGAIRTAVVARMPGYSVPMGSFEGVTGGIGSATVSGWAVDWDRPESSATVDAYVDGRPTARWTTTAARPDVARSYPTIGAHPGFRNSLALSPGGHDVCVYAINVGPGSPRGLGCRPVVVLPPRPSPQGALDSATAVGNQAFVRGWAVDEDQMTTSLRVHVYVDGRLARAGTADRPDSRVAARYPVAGAAHGFAEVVPLSAGTHQVCAYAINVGGYAGNPSLGCRTVAMGAAASNPTGRLVSAVPSGRTATVTGWAVDPQAPASAIAVHLYVDGVFRQAVPADVVTSAVAALAPLGVTTAHGFQVSLSLAGGVHRVCAYGINTGAGTGNPLLGCAAVTVAPSAWNPIGSLDGVDVAGRTVTVTGWALDHDTETAPIGVHVYVDGRLVRSLPADVPRADVAAANPAAGPDHGFTSGLTLAAGSHTVCAYAINVGSGSANVQLGCRTVAMPADAYNPLGSLDTVAVVPGALDVRGWAYDPDSPATAIRVHVYVDGHGISLAADLSRPDVATVHPEAGALHGYETTVPVAAGPHTVCAYAINVDTGTENPTLGCQNVTS